MRSTGKRLSVIGPCLLLGALCTGLYSVSGLPSGMAWGARLEAWAWMMSGPAFLAALGGGPVPDAVGCSVCLGWLALPALLAHPLRPNVITGCLTALGALFWFTSGIFTMIMCAWGA
jgi:hypothetical protein